MTVLNIITYIRLCKRVYKFTSICELSKSMQSCIPDMRGSVMITWTLLVITRMIIVNNWQMI